MLHLIGAEGFGSYYLTDSLTISMSLTASQPDPKSYNFLKK